MLAEVFFCLLDLAGIEQQEVTETAVCKFVYNRAAEELCEEVVDECADEGAQRRE